MSHAAQSVLATRYKLKFVLSPDQINAAKQQIAAEEAAFNKGTFMRLLAPFPKNMQVAVGTTIVLAGSVFAYNFLRPGEATQMKTLSKEWMEATRQYQAAQNQNPIRRYGDQKKLNESN